MNREEQIKAVAAVVNKGYNDYLKHYGLLSYNPEMPGEIIAAAILESGSLPSVVGQLQWVWDEIRKKWIAETPIGTYMIYSDGQVDFARTKGLWELIYLGDVTQEAAKDFAQSHYAQIIGSCLKPKVLPVGEELENIADEALNKIHEHTTLCTTEEEKHIFLCGFNEGLRHEISDSCLVGGGPELPITDHDLRLIAQDWLAGLKYNNPGTATAFAAGYRMAERKNGCGYTEEQVLGLIESLKYYTRESHAILGFDERTSKEFLDTYLVSLKQQTDQQQ